MPVGHVFSVPAWLPDPAAVVSTALREGVVVLVNERLTAPLVVNERIAAYQAAFAEAARQQTVQALWLRVEATRLLNALDEAGVRVLVLKGVALAHWLYPASHLRQCGDMDLLLASVEEAEKAVEVLTSQGYDQGYEQGPHSYERVRKPSSSSRFALELDLHWRLLNAPVFARALQFEALWARSIVIPALGIRARGLGPGHALLHAAMNRAVNLYSGEGDPLKGLYDIGLLVQSMTQPDWDEVLDTASLRSLCGVLWSALASAQIQLRVPVSLLVMQRLQAQSKVEDIDASRLSEWGYMQRRNLAALPWRQRGSWLWGRLLPPRNYMRSLHGQEKTLPGLLVARGQMLLRRLSAASGHSAITVRWMLGGLLLGLALLLIALVLPSSAIAWFYRDDYWLGRGLISLETTHFPFSRWFHVLIFAWLTMCVRYLFPRLRWWHVGVSMLGIAVVGELLQIPIPGRQAGISDLADDLIGVWLGLMLAALLLQSRKLESPQQTS